MKTTLLVILLGGLLVVAVGGSIRILLELNDVEMSLEGFLAMTLGVVFSLVLGIGLMRLVYRSERESNE